MNNLNVLYEDNHIIVVEKKPNILSQSDITGDKDLLTMVKEYVKEKYKQEGNVYIGLVHRLDRPVGGIMVFAKTSKAASRLSDQIRTNSFKKVYSAIIVNSNLPSSSTLTDYLLKNTKTNTVTCVKENTKDSKKAVLHYRVLSKINDLTLVKIQLETGRSHQIRVQFSSRNAPLWGDQRYNKDAKPGQQIALWASSLTILHPTSKEEMTFTSEMPSSYPWNIFKGEK